MEGLMHRDYLGDGVYAGWDGYQIWLSTLEGASIALDDQVRVAFRGYESRLHATLNAERAAALERERQENDRKQEEGA